MPRTREASAMAVMLVNCALESAREIERGELWPDGCGARPRELEEAKDARADLLAYIGQLELRCEEMAQQLAPRIPSMQEWR